MDAGPTWLSTVTYLRNLTTVPAAQANAVLADGAGTAWDGKVICRSSMHDLLFTLPGDDYPWRADIRVSWIDGVFEVRLERGGLLVTADRCRDEMSQVLLDSFLHQLVAEG